MGGSSRNAPCPCGSGRKHKACCLAHQEATAIAARLADRVYERLQDWSLRAPGGELERARLEFDGGDDGELADHEIDLFCAWFHLDRKLPGGGTPIERYAAEARLTAPEREVAAALADAPLGLHRVLAVDSGRALELEDVLLGTRTRCRSPHVSKDVVRWDLVLCRVTREGSGHGLFGPARIFGPSDEDELRRELERHSGGGPLDREPATVESLFRRCGSDLLRFVTPSARAEASFFSVEGHPAVHAEAAWRIEDHIAVGNALEAVPDLFPLGPDGDGGEAFEWIADRRAIDALREELPLGAICIEATPVSFDEHGFSVPDGGVAVGTFELRPGELTFSALSEQRLDAALRLVYEHLGAAADLERRELTRLDPGRGEPPAEAPEPSGLSAVETSVVEARLFEHRYHGWLDEANPALGGATPRTAAREPGRRAEVESLVRRIENGAERSARGPVAPDLSWLRDELGLEAHPARARRAA